MPSLLSAILAVALLAPAALGAGRQIAPRPLIGANPRVFVPIVAEAGGRFLTAWIEDGDFTAARVMGAITDGRGERQGPAFLIADIGHNPLNWSMLEVAGAGDSFAVFWTDGRRVTRMVDVALDGRVLRTRTLDLPPHTAPRVAWNGKHFLIVAGGAAALLSRDGTVLHGGMPLGIVLVKDIVATPAQFLVFSASIDHFNAHAIAADGSSVTTTAMGPYASDVRAAVLPNGDVLVVSSAVTCYDARLIARVWSNGRVATHEILSSDWSRPLQVMPGNDRHLVAFAREEGGRTLLATMFVGNDGTPRSEVTDSGVDLGYISYDSASNGARFFVGYRNRGISGVAVERNGTVRAPVALSVEPAEQSPPLLAAAGGTVLAGLTEVDEDGTRVRAVVLGPDVATESDHQVVSEGMLDAEDVAWNGSEFLAVVRPQYGLIATRIRADGSPVPVPPVTLWMDTPWHVAVAWAGDRWAVVWTRDHYIWIATVTPDGVASEYREIRRNSPPVDPLVKVNITGITLAYDGSNLHVTWIEGGRGVFTTRVSPDGTQRDASALAIPASGAWHLSAAAGNDTLLVLVEELGRTTVSSIGTSRVVSTRALYDWPAYGDITWDGVEFVAGLRARGRHWYTSLFRLAPDGNIVAAPRGIATVGPQTSGRLSVAAAPAFGAILGMQESDTTSGTRAVVYSERDLPPLPAPPPPPANVRRLPGDEIEWDDTAEAYSIEKLTSAGEIVHAGITDEPHFRQQQDVIRIRAFANGAVSAPTAWIGPLPRRRIVRY